MYWPVIHKINITINPYNPSKNTNFNGFKLYLLKIHFYETRPPPLKTNDDKSRITPKIWLYCVEDDELTTATTSTPVIPTNAITHPIIAFL